MAEQIFVGVLLFIVGVFVMGVAAMVLVVLYELGRMIVRKIHDRVFRRGTLK